MSILTQKAMQAAALAIVVLFCTISAANAACDGDGNRYSYAYESMNECLGQNETNCRGSLESLENAVNRYAACIEENKLSENASERVVLKNMQILLKGFSDKAATKNHLFKDIHNFDNSDLKEVTAKAIENALEPYIIYAVSGFATIEQLEKANRGQAIPPPPNWLSNPKDDGQWTLKYRNGVTVIYSISRMIDNGHIIIASNFTEIYHSEINARRLQQELMQSQKLEAIGTLSGGIAHELNTPIQFIGDNLAFISSITTELVSILQLHKTAQNMVEAGVADNVCAENAAKALADFDLDYFCEELPAAINQSINGVKQMSEIIRAMKEFSYPTIKEKSAVDVNHALERASIVARNEWKYLATIEWDLENPPPIAYVNEGELNQVFINIIVNAAHAIKSAERSKGEIFISSMSREDKVLITITDNGTGIPEDIQDRIFDQFFTTKAVGKGTGQGLSLCHEFVVKRNDGKISFGTQKDCGTNFIIELPKAAASTKIY